MHMNRFFFLSFAIFTFFSISAKHCLVFGGKTGWIGQKIVTLLQNNGYEVTATQTRLEKRELIEKEIAIIKPDCIINAAGVTGRPNVDWCESNKQEAIRSNIIGALTVADVAYMHNIYCITIGTGCIYEYDEAHPMGSCIGFTEEDTPNFHGSFYSHTKCMLDDLIGNYPNNLMLRVRMPISSDLHPRNFITKITKYAKIVNVPNSMSILDDLLALIPDMIERKLVGAYNFVNPGVISHNEILDLYKEYIDPNFTYENFSLEEQAKILKAGRSNNELDTAKLLKEFPDVPHIKESITNVFKKMKQLLNNETH